YVGAALAVAALIAGFAFFFQGERRPDEKRLTQEGWELWQAQRWNEAINNFTEALKLAPRNVNARNGLGWALFNSGQAEEAENAFQKVIALEPNHPGARNGLGQIYLSQRKYAEAEEHLLIAAPQAPAAWHGLARLYLLQGKFEQAERYAKDLVDSGQADELARRMLKAAQAKQLSEGLRLMIEPPSETKNVRASVGTWSPPLAPGEKPNVQNILEEARDLAQQGRFEEALQRHLWYHYHALESAPSQSGVRLSFALSYWKELARRYPKAKQALVEIRDRGTQEFAIGGGHFALFMEVSALNRELGEPDATFALFKSIRSRNPPLARQCYYAVSDLLIEKGDYALCASFIPNFQEQFENIHAVWERTLAVADRTPEANQALVRQEAQRSFIKDTRGLIEILVGIRRIVEAEKIREQAVAILNVPELQSAVSDADERAARFSAAAPATTELATAVIPTSNTMRLLATRICEGDDAAFGELRRVAGELYRNINYTREQGRVSSNLFLMRAAFRELGEQAGRSNSQAMAALQSAAFARDLTAHVSDALGLAAAAGNEQALDMLLHHQDWNMLQSSAVFALRAPAEKNNEQAIDFLVAVLGSEGSRPLWHGASEGLKVAAASGNLKAQAALEKYEQAKPKLRSPPP
ncbi:MAG TPA: tetratricopeptide repeat protein, partial [Verrucomicrobiae bacterium]